MISGLIFVGCLLLAYFAYRETRIDPRGTLPASLADWPQRPAPTATDNDESNIENPPSPFDNPRFRLNLFVCGHLVRYAMRYRADDGQVYVWKFGPTDFHTLHTDLLALQADPESEFCQQDLDRVEDGMRLGLNAILKQHGALP